MICNVNVALDFQLSIYLTLAKFDMYAQKPFLFIYVGIDLKILGVDYLLVNNLPVLLEFGRDQR